MSATVAGAGSEATYMSGWPQSRQLTGRPGSGISESLIRIVALGQLAGE